MVVKLTYKDMVELHHEAVTKRNKAIAHANAVYNEQSKSLSEGYQSSLPLKVGDVITIKGWTHNGKKGIIEEIGIVLNPNTMGTRGVGCLCTVLKKDGTVAKAAHKAYVSMKHFMEESPNNG